MNLSAEENGILVKGFLKKRLIPYDDIKSIVAEAVQRIVVRTYGKEEFVDTSLVNFLGKTPAIYDKIREYNIAYRDETELGEDGVELYSKDEATVIYEKQLDMVKEPCRELVRERLGPKFDLEFRVMSIFAETSVYIQLLRNGKVVSDIPSPMSNYEEDGIADAFDVTQLTYLAEWDPKQKAGRYTMMPEAKDPEKGRKYFLEIVSDFCDEYLEANSREYLDQLP